MIEGVTKPTENIFINCLVYGPPKSGKSWFGESFPDPYFIITERTPKGLNSNKSFPYVIVESYSDIKLVINQIVRGDRAKENKSIIFDSISDMTDLVKVAVRQLMGKTSDKDFISQPMWGLASDYIRETNRVLSREIGKIKHVCVIARSQIEKDGVVGKLVELPETIGKYSGVIGGQYDLLLYSEQYLDGKGKKSWRLHTSAGDFYKAGDGLGGFLANEEPNNFNIIYSKIQRGILENFKRTNL